MTMYPLPNLDTSDKRFSARLVDDVAQVLEMHGFPPVRTGSDLASLRQCLAGFLYSGSSTPALWCSPDGPEDEGVTGPALPLSGVSPDAQRQGTPDRPGWMGHNHALAHYDRLGICEMSAGVADYRLRAGGPL